MSHLLIVAVHIIGASVLVDGLPRLRLAPGPTFRRFVREDDGREVLLRGFNAVVKGAPWLPSRGKFDARTSLISEDFLQIRALGMNIIRLGVMWPGVEIAPGIWNETYLTEVRKIVTEASEHGIYTLLDMHQDMLSSRTCGEGVVEWAVNVSSLIFPKPVRRLGFETDDLGHPSRKDCDSLSPWYYGQGSDAVAKGFQSLYSGQGLILWARVWKQIAAATYDLPGVIGFELLNEPSLGDVLRDPLLLNPSHAERVNLQPAYDTVAKAIREVAPQSLIFFQPILINPFFGFQHAPGGAEFADRSVLAFHHYAFPPAHQLVENRVRSAVKLGTGLIASEFNRPSMSNPWNDTEFAEMVEASDSAIIGWAIWELKPYCDDATSFGACVTGVGDVDYLGTITHPNIDLQKLLARPFTPVVSGQLLAYRFDPRAVSLDLQLNFTRGSSLATEVFVSPLWFPHEANIHVSARPSVLISERNGSTLRLLPASAQWTGGVVNVLIARPAIQSTHSSSGLSVVV